MEKKANLTNIIFSYLQIKDLSQVEQVNKEWTNNCKNFDPYWKEDCVNIFSSEYNHLEYLFFVNPSVYQISSVKDNRVYNFIPSHNMKWKNLFKKMIENRNSFKNKFFEEYEILNMKEDSVSIEELIFQRLKEFISLPKLRRENLFLENLLNTNHQIHNYDFLYDLQDLYDYYDRSSKKNNDFCNSIQFHSSEIQVRCPELPFATLLQNYIDIFIIINKNEENKIKLSKFRWYQTISVDLETMETDPLVYILHLISQKFTLFCQMTFSYLIEESLKENQSHYANEYIKRYKAYVDAAININEQLENLNVLVNTLYEDMFPGMPCNPKFSIYRLMINMWNQEVLSKLINSEDERCNLISICSNYFRQYIRKEIKNSQRPGDDYMNFGDYYDNSNRTSCSSNSSILSEVNFKKSPLQDEAPFSKLQDNSFSERYFIEQLSSCIVDMDCNEYSVFYINHSGMKVSENYMKMEQSFVEILNEETENMGITYIDKMLENCDRSRTGDTFFGIRLLNRTYFSLLKCLIQKCISINIKKVGEYLSEFLENSKMTEEGLIQFIKSKRSLEEFVNRELSLEAQDEMKFFIHQLFLTSETLYKNNTVSQCATYFFLNEMKNNSNCTILLNQIEYSVELYFSNLKEFLLIDKKVEKENRRKNIMKDLPRNDELLLTYVSEINYAIFCTIYNENLTQNFSLEEEVTWMKNKNLQTEDKMINLSPFSTMDSPTRISDYTEFINDNDINHSILEIEMD
jgi:hypothetical protein